MSYKIIVSKPGYNAGTVTDPSLMIFSSDYNTLKYDISGSTNVTINAGGAGFYEGTTTINHGLGYKPFFHALGRVSTDATDTYRVLPIAFQLNDNVEVYADSNNIYCYAGWNFAGAGALTFYFIYKVFKNNTGL